jgi:hypothetical protein
MLSATAVAACTTVTLLSLSFSFKLELELKWMVASKLYTHPPTLKPSPKRGGVEGKKWK